MSVATIAPGNPAVAADASPDPWAGVEEMVVTGGDNTAALLRSSNAVTAFDADAIAKQNITDISDLDRFTPNLEIKTAGSTTPALFIRGVGLNSFDANAAGAVAVYQDDVALNLPGFQAGQLFDLEGIEVLKGPQGSGPGWNASAGAIRIRSREPNGDFGATLRTDFGNYEFVEVEGAVGGPIIEDRLSTRIAFKVRQRDGLVENRCGGLPRFNPDDPDDPINLDRVVDPSRATQSLCGEVVDAPLFVRNPNPPPSQFRISRIAAGLEKNLNDLGDWGLRGQLRLDLEPLDQKWIFGVRVSQIDQLATVGQPLGTTGGYLGGTTAAPQSYVEPEIRRELDGLLARAGVLGVPSRICREDPACVAATARAQAGLARNLASDRPLDRKPFTGAYNLPGFERQQTFGISLRGSGTAGPVDLRSVTSFNRYDRERLVDFDFTPTTIFEFDLEDDAWQVTQDLSAEVQLDALPIVARVGAYTLIEELDSKQETLAGGDVRPLSQEFEQRLYGLAAYGELEWELSETLELSAGLRFNWERKEFDVSRIALVPTQNLCVDGFGGDPSRVPDCRERRTLWDPSGEVSLTYHMTEDVSGYAKFSRGWKGSQFNVANGTTRDAFTYAKPETIDAVEFGFDSSWLGGRAALSAALFLYRYADYQVFLFTNDSSAPPQRIVENANAARVYGADGEIRLEPIDRFVIKLDWSWIESAFLDFKDSGIRRIAVGDGAPPRIAEIPIDFTGNRLPNTPRFKVSARVEYGLEFRFGTITPLYSVVYTDDAFFDPSNGRGAPNNQGEIFLPKYTIGQKGFILHDLRVGYSTPGEHIEVALWVRNLTNEVYKQVSYDATAIAGLVGNFVGNPRTYGLSAKLAF
ncbi:MAG: TonB-dependent receptor [Spirochaetaceae bacterium]|nr:TonB-dependent receptor [Myxococcales bacterium]MCB9725479.1 TonB-dependent receptor [Spirochaetaceae bacterium]